MDETQTAPATGLTGPLALLRQAWSIYKSKIKLLAGILLVPLLLGVLVNIVNPDYLEASSWNPLWIILQVAMTLLFIASMVWGQASLITALRDRQEELSVEEAYRRSRPLIWSYLWVMILNAFIVIGGFFLFIIPGIYFMFLFAFSLFVLAVEGDKGMKALLKSREYVRGHWWGVLGRYLVVVITAMIVYGLINSLAFLISDEIAWISLMSSVASLFTVPFMVTYFFLLYEGLKSLKGQVVLATDSKEYWVYLIAAALGYLLIIVLLAMGVLFTVLGFFLGWMFSGGSPEGIINTLPPNTSF